MDGALLSCRRPWFQPPVIHTAASGYTHAHAHTPEQRWGQRWGKDIKIKSKLSSVLRKQISFSSQTCFIARKGHCIRLNPGCLVPSKQVCSDPCIVSHHLTAVLPAPLLPVAVPAGLLRHTSVSPLMSQELFFCFP